MENRIPFISLISTKYTWFFLIKPKSDTEVGKCTRVYRVLIYVLHLDLEKKPHRLE